MGDEKEFLKRIRKYNYASLTISIIMISLGFLFLKAIVVRFLEEI